MKKLYIIAALLMASTAAHAGNSVSFDVDGHKVRIEVPRNCDSLSCIQISAPGSSGFNFKGLNFKRFDDDSTIAERTDPAPQNATPAPAVQAAPPQPAAPAATATTAPAAIASTDPVPAVGFDTRTAPSAAAPAAPQPAPVAVAPVAAPTTPLGVWATEENKGNVRVEPCGQDVCGYAVNTGEKILINMRPSDTKWVGQIHDPDSGRNYDSTIAMKGANSMRVEGCAFGGMFCGGQIWKRVS
jgi:uncharacterized protein (DUF2147 family)